MNRRLLLQILALVSVPALAYGAEIKFTGASGRDPFAPPFDQRKTGEDPGAAEKRLQSLTVQGVVASAANPRAIINGKIYRVGSELLPGIKISRIEKDGVFVTSGDKEILLSRPTQTTKGKNPNEPKKAPYTV